MTRKAKFKQTGETLDVFYCCPGVWAEVPIPGRIFDKEQLEFLPEMENAKKTRKTPSFA